MGYEIPAGIGVKLAEPEREVVVMIGDGTYLMLNSEIVTAVAEGIGITIVVFDNHGYQCIKDLAASVRRARVRQRAAVPRRRHATASTGGYVPGGLPKHAEAMGALALLRAHRGRDPRRPSRRPGRPTGSP